jgi:ABC-type Fe3+-hydroxamate transport system substrate-binding protein
MPATMWEVRGVEDRFEELLAWVLERVDPATQVYRSSDGQPRVVVIDPSGQASQTLAGVPSEFIARPAHSWNFDQVRNGRHSPSV